MSEISIVIPTFNSKEFIKPCLESLYAQNYQNLEVIVIDNGSKDGTVSFIKENYSHIILIDNEQNFGAAKGRNQGIEIASGNWIVTLDCDTILEKNFLNKIAETIKIVPGNVGMIQPKIMNLDKKTIYSYGICLSWLRRFYDIGKGKIDTGRFSKSKYVFGACSAAAVYKKQMLEEIKENTGYFDERFFFLVEDVDLAWRAQKRGWKALFLPQTVCYHFGNSSGYNKKIRQYLCFRNRYFLVLKNDNINAFRNIIFIILYDLPRLFYLMLTNNYIRKAVSNIKVLHSEEGHSNYVN